MAHMSPLEKAQAKMKKLRKRSTVKDTDLTEEEKAEKEMMKNRKTLTEEVNLAIYDFQHRQLSRLKYPHFMSILRQRIDELNKELKEVPNMDLDKDEIGKYELRIKFEINKLEGVLNAIN